jgi:chromosome partitioning protein
MFSDEISFNQRTIARLLDSSPATVNRIVTTKQIPATLETDKGKIKKYNLENTRKIAELILKNQRPKIYNKINVFYNFKGGTGKTSLCYQVACHLAILGYSVLAIDLDPQGHLSSALRVPEDVSYHTMYDVLINGIDIEESILTVFPGLDLVPANISMTRIEVPLSSKTKREEKLRLLLDPLKNKYDFILIDTNPTISTLNLNALVAADRVNVVCETQPFSLSGLKVLVEEMLQFYNEMHVHPNFGIIANKYESKTAISQEVLGALRTEYKDNVLDTVVRKCEDINISAKKKVPIFAFANKHSIAIEDILDLVKEIIRHASVSFEYPKNKIWT